MAVSIFLNFEKISTQIIEDEITKMTDDNILYSNDEQLPDIVNEEPFINNLYHGAIAATFIVNLYETALNIILSKRLGCIEQEILKTSQGVKLQLICTMYHVDFQSIKSNNAYAAFQAINKLRNDITHYKNNELSMGHFISSETTLPMGTSKDSLAKMFTKTYMEKSYNGVVDLINLICEKCNLILNKECNVIDCDGRDTLCEYIVTKESFECSDRYDS